eukprot:TRINITY_DN43183_c0_g1_i1.p1 TRINITY_DN43183_c0_g1~~TRINITY_DN43183_c0_g1_i1.p1  ORF type:complete len:1002 (-),score=143.82 TRINITY_DN43183_c0_g1_i1:276-3239(-)
MSHPRPSTLGLQCAAIQGPKELHPSAGIPHSGTSGTPLLDANGNIYYTDFNGSIMQVSADGCANTFYEAEEKAAGTPALGEGALFTALVNGCAASIDLKTKVVGWQRKFAGACSQDYFSIVVSNQVLIIPAILDEPRDWSMLPPADHIFALEAVSGKTKWKFKPDVMLNNCTPCAAEDEVFFTDLFGGLYCLSLSVGVVKWKLKGEGSMLSRNLGGANVVNDVVYQTVNLKAKKAWNAPFGGKGALRAYNAKDGAQKWEVLFELEANSIPAVVPGPGGELYVVVGLGANAGSAATAPVGDTFTGKVVAVDTQKGSVVWTFEPEPWKHIWAAGCTPMRAYKFNSWSTAAYGADGTIYIAWHGGIVFGLDVSTGKVLCSSEIGMAVQGTPLVFSKGLCVPSGSVCWLGNAPLVPAPPQLMQPIEQLDTGRPHLWPCRIGQNADRPYAASCQAPADLSKPTWCHKFKDRRAGDWNLGSPVIDSNRNIYSGLMSGSFVGLRPDGTHFGSFTTPAPASISNVALHGKHVFVLDDFGYVRKFHLETLQQEWASRIGVGGFVSGAGLSVFGDIIFVPSCGKSKSDAEDQIVAIETSDGTIKWRHHSKHVHYNSFPQVQGDRVVFGCLQGGWVAVSASDGTTVSEWYPPYKPYESFTTAGPAIGCDGQTVYVTSNLPSTRKTPPSGFQDITGAGIVRGFNLETAEVKWEKEYALPCTQVPIIVPKALIVGSGADIVAFGTGYQACASPSDVDVLKLVHSFQGTFYGLDSDTGNERWSFTPPPLKSVYPPGTSDGDIIPPDAWGSAVVDSKGTIYVYWQGGHVYAISGSTGKELSRYYIGAVANGAPAIAPGMLIVASFDRVICWRDPALEEQWIVENGGQAGMALRGTGVEEETGPLPVRGTRLLEPAKPEVKTAQETGPGTVWLVVGGGDKGGIVVRKAESLKSPELARLGTGARVEELERIGERLHYKKLAGDGPDFGWVSTSIKGNPLLTTE